MPEAQVPSQQSPPAASLPGPVWDWTLFVAVTVPRPLGEGRPGILPVAFGGSLVSGPLIPTSPCFCLLAETLILETTDLGAHEDAGPALLGASTLIFGNVKGNRSLGLRLEIMSFLNSVQFGQK